MAAARSRRRAAAHSRRLAAAVTEAMDALWPQDRWIGKRNRGDLTEPVRRLRASVQRLGLLRAASGRLLVTKAGAALREDPGRLWKQVAERSAGRLQDAFARTATALVLVAAAGGPGRKGQDPRGAVCDDGLASQS